MKTVGIRSHSHFLGLNDTCSFCGKRSDEYGRLFERNGIGICDGCVTLVEGIAKSGKFRRPADLDHVTCSFCSKQQSSGVSLVAGPGVCICSECGATYFLALEKDGSE